MAHFIRIFCICILVYFRLLFSNELKIKAIGSKENKSVPYWSLFFLMRSISHIYWNWYLPLRKNSYLHNFMRIIQGQNESKKNFLRDAILYRYTTKWVQINSTRPFLSLFLFHLRLRNFHSSDEMSTKNSPCFRFRIYLKLVILNTLF